MATEPSEVVSVRDFAYSQQDPRHTGLFAETEKTVNRVGSYDLAVAQKMAEDPTENEAPEETIRVKALYDFETSVEGELGFKANDIITISDNRGDGWLTGSLSGVVGFVPESYVKRLDDETTTLPS